MRSRAQSAEHAETVSRRLRLLSAELSAIRPVSAPDAELSETAGRGAAGMHSVGTDVAGTHAVGADAAALLPVDEHTHLRELRVVDEPPPGPTTTVPDGETHGDARRPAPSVAAPSVPVPGRHAARRGIPRPWLDVSAFRGRVSLGPSSFAVLAVLVAAGLGITAWWVIRDDPGVSVAAPTTGSSLATPVATGGSPTAGGAETGAGSGAGSGEVVVDVTGKVRDPGIVVLPAGSRVVDALKAAGGVRRGADLTGLNRARLVQDGEQIVVGIPAPPGVAASAAPSSGGATGGGASGGGLVNLNTASATELEELPGVGPVTASKIVDWREANGGFANVDQLLEVDGIGEKTLAEIAPHVTL